MDKRYTSSIPKHAKERVTVRFPNGSTNVANYLVRGKVVGEWIWDEVGNVSMEIPYKKGQVHGIQYGWYFDGILTVAIPYHNGKEHGIAKQWDESGKLIGTYSMKHGTGIDLWREQRFDGHSCCLSEVRYMKDGDRHGVEWWIDQDQKTVYEERHFKIVKLHGIERSWNSQNRLRRGHPKYFVEGEQVTKRQYLNVSKTDPSLPRYHERDTRPARTFPPEISRRLLFKNK